MNCDGGVAFRVQISILDSMFQYLQGPRAYNHALKVALKVHHRWETISMLVNGSCVAASTAHDVSASCPTAMAPSCHGLTFESSAGGACLQEVGAILAEQQSVQLASSICEFQAQHPHPGALVLICMSSCHTSC